MEPDESLFIAPDLDESLSEEGAGAEPVPLREGGFTVPLGRNPGKPVVVDRTGDGVVRRSRGSHAVDWIVLHFCVGSEPVDLIPVLKQHKLGYHYIIGLDGQILQVVPTDQLTFHCGGRNKAASASPHGTLHPHQRPGELVEFPDGTGFANSRSIGVSFVSEVGFSDAERPSATIPGVHPLRGDGFYTDFSGAPLDAAVRLLAWLCFLHGVDPSTNLVPHGNHPQRAGLVAHKSDPGPGLDLEALVAGIRQQLKLELVDPVEDPVVG